MTRNQIFAAAFLVLTSGVSATAHANLVATGSVGGAPVGVTKDNLDSLPLGIGGGVTSSGMTVSFVTDAATVSGTVANIYAAPFLSGGNGLGFGPGGTNQANGADTTNYVTTGSTGAFAGAQISFVLPGQETYFGLLWGSVDTYNTLQFYNGATLVGTLTGSDVLAGANGDQGVNGTLYVNINSDLSFDRVVATSSQYAFEIDNIAFNPTNVPEPVSLALLGSGLLGLGVIRRKRA